MNEDTGPVKVNEDLNYSQKADQLMIDLLSQIRDDMSSTRGWVVFIGILFLLGLIGGLILGACGLLV